MTYVIRDMPPDDRPRERMLKHGPRTLSDAELLAIILGTGAPGKNAVHLARELLIGGIHSLRDRDVAMLARVRGVGPAKAARISAVMEMCRRVTVTPEPVRTYFDTGAFGARLVKAVGHHQQERLGTALLDARHRIINEREIFIGTLDKALVSTSDIIRFALLERAKGVVIYHNHPSGDPTPSDDDLAFTRMLKQSLAMMDLDLVDHLVIGAHRYHSMKARGDL